jgi:hypothetical protein
MMYIRYKSIEIRTNRTYSEIKRMRLLSEQNVLLGNKRMRTNFFADLNGIK